MQLFREQRWEEVHHMCVFIQNLEALSESLTLVKKTEYIVEEGITKLPKERNSNMLLHVCL